MKNRRIILFLASVVSVVIGLVVFVVLSKGFTQTAVYLTILVGLFLVFGTITFIQNRKNVVESDEMQKTMLRIAASRSFIISFYPWVILLIFDDLFASSITQISVGVMAMAVIFLINYLIVKLIGPSE